MAGKKMLSRLIAALLALAAKATFAFVPAGSHSTSLTQPMSGGSGSGGTFGVGSTAAAPDLFTGTLQHVLAIEAVRGRHGMQPNVTLRYRSTSGNGPLGVGWELELGSIERQTKNGLDFNSDNYILRSSGAAVDLVNVGPATYQAKFESSFLRIQKSVDGKSWVVTDRSGTVSTYGTAAASRQDSVDGTSVFKWCLDHVQDANGNYMTFSYTKLNGQIYPAEIDYTGHTSGLSPTNSLTFNWTTRTDTAGLGGYRTGFQVLTGQILDHIDVNAAGQLVRRYQLGYSTSPSTTRALLTSFTQIGKDATTTLPATNIDYATPTTVPSPTWSNALSGQVLLTNTYASWNSIGGWIRAADVDGDGFTDVVLGPSSSGAWYVLNGSANGLVTRGNGMWLTGALAGWGSCSNGCEHQIFTADLRGLGREDIIAGPDQVTGDWNVILSNGTSFASPVTWATSTTYPASTNWFGKSPRIRFADIDGDGRTDVFIGPDANGTFDLLKSTGSSFEVHAGFAATGVSGFDCDGTFDCWTGDHSNLQDHVWLVDVTGDGLPDIVMGPDPAGLWYVSVNSAGTFGLATVWSTGNMYGGTPLQIRALDMNGDGKTDFILGPDASGAWYVIASTGSGFVLWGVPYASSYGAWSDKSNEPRIRPIDLNADGLPDFVIGPDSNGNWAALVNKGAGFIDHGVQLSGFSGAPWDDSDHQSLIRPMDLNGDGIPEIVLGPDSTGQWSAVSAPAPYSDLLTRLRNGYGATLTIQYTPSTRFQNRQLPFAMQVATTVTVDDGNSVSAATKYSYAGGYFSPGQREFRGFTPVTVTGPAWPGGTQSQTMTYFHQGAGVTPAADDPVAPATAYMQGRAYTVVASDTASGVYSETDTTYQDAAVAPYFDPAIKIVHKVCSNPSNCVWQTERDFTFDSSYGNLIREDDYDTTNSLNNKSTVWAFSPNSSSYIVSLPFSKTTYSGNATPPNQFYKIDEVDYRFDGAADCSAASTNTTPITGNITSVFHWLNPRTIAASPETRAGYDQFGNTTCTHDPLGNATLMSYDSGTATFLLSVTNAKGHVSSTSYYGVNGVPWSNSAGDPGVFGLIKSTIDPNLATVTNSYDVFGRTINQAGPDAFSTSSSYNSLGTVSSQNVRTVSPLGTSETYFDGLGRTIKTRQLGPGTPICTTESAQWIDTLTYYLATSAVAQSSAPYFESNGVSSARWTNFQYDAQGRPLKVTNPDGTTVLNCYDDIAAISATVDPNQHIKRTGQDAYGRLSRVDEYQGTQSGCTTNLGTPYSTTTYSYDLFSRLDQILVTTRNSPVAFAYDTLGRQVSSSDPDLGNWSYVYDDAGNLTSQQDANGNTISYPQYDVLNRPLTKQYPAGPSISYTYDDPNVSYSKGRLTAMADSSGNTTYAYDVMGRVTSTTQTISPSPPVVDATYTVHAAFDNSTRRATSVTYPDTSQVNYSYDANGNLCSVADSSTVYATLKNYNELGQVGTITYGNTATATYTYDSSNRRLNHLLTTKGNLSSLVDLTYQYDPAGNVTRMVDGTNTSNTQVFGYDELNRLTRAQSMGYAPDTYLPPAGLVYTYDPVRIHVLTSTSDGQSFVHDANGNRKSDGSRSNIIWDYDNHPTSITMGGLATTFSYDGNGTRVKKVSPSGNVLYSGKLYECAGSSCKRYIFMGPLRIAQTSAGGTSYFQTDHLQSSRIQTDASQNIQESSFYQPFGRMLADSNSTLTRYKFTGQEWDSETGLYNYGARLYDPALGRFLSADSLIASPAGPQSLNRYSYALNNPLTFSDPTGHGVWDSIEGFFHRAYRAYTSSPQSAALETATLGLDIYTGGALTPMLAGEVLGGASAQGSGGDVFTGELVGGYLGQAGALTGGLIDANVGTYPVQVAKGAFQGSIYGGSQGWAAGYSGGTSGLGAEALSVIEGAAIGASVGALKPLVIGKASVDPGVRGVLEEEARKSTAYGRPVDSSLVTVRTGGLWMSAYHLIGKAGATFANTMNIDDLSDLKVVDGLIGHEISHIADWQNSLFGWNYASQYFYYLVTRGYDQNPFEIKARAFQLLPWPYPWP